LRSGCSAVSAAPRSARFNWSSSAHLWNVAVTLGLIASRRADATSFAFLQLPRYVATLIARRLYAAIAVAGILAWTGRRVECTYAAQCMRSRRCFSSRGFFPPRR